MNPIYFIIGCGVCALIGFVGGFLMGLSAPRGGDDE